MTVYGKILLVHTRHVIISWHKLCLVLQRFMLIISITILTYFYFKSLIDISINEININENNINNNIIHYFSFFSCCLVNDYILINATVCTIKNFLCHNIKQAVSYHIMEFYIMTCCMSWLSWHPKFSNDFFHNLGRV